MLLIIGVSAIIKPITYNLSYNIDMIFLTIGTILLFIFPRICPTCRISKVNGLIYVLLYGGYMVTAFLR